MGRISVLSSTVDCRRLQVSIVLRYLVYTSEPEYTITTSASIAYICVTAVCITSVCLVSVCLASVCLASVCLDSATYSVTVAAAHR